MAGLLSIALTGINASQAGLTTTSHNITNANVTGYTRQQVVQGTQDPMYFGSGFFGQGTRVDTVKRIYNQFLDNQVLAANASKVQYQTYADQISQIDNLLADETAGVAPALQDFFSAVDDVSTTPSNISSRQALISSAQSLVARFQSINARLEEIRDGVDGEIAASAESITGFAKQIADLNHKITVAQSAGPGVPANDMIDERNRVISQLNEQVKTTTQTESDGSVSIFIGTGQPLVVGTTYFAMTTAPSSTDARRTSIHLGTPGGASVELAESLLTGGNLAGLLSFRSEALDSAENALGRIAVGLTSTFNAQHRLGQDLNGNLGDDFFGAMTPSVQSLSGAVGSVTASFADVNGLTDDDYVVTVSGGVATVKRYATGEAVSTSVSGVPPRTYFDGLSIDISGATSGSFLIQPTRFAAQNIGINITTPREIAAAAPFKAAAQTANTGTGAISQGTMLSLSELDANADQVADFTGTISLTYSGGVVTAVASNGTPVTLYAQNSAGNWVADSSYSTSSDASGKTFRIGLGTGTGLMSVTLSGKLANNDVFTIAPTGSSGVSDNRNALALGNLQLTKTLNGATYETAYAQLVADVGIKANSANVNVTAQEALLAQATAAQQAVSGVNLDEEAANLLRYQQAYQASARVLNVASSLFDEIL